MRVLPSFTTALFFFICCLSVQGEDRIKIGVVSVLTGENAPTGLDVKDAIVFADKRYGRGRYELVVEDDHCNGKDGVSIAQKFTTIDKVKAVVGFTCSASMLPAAPIYEKAGIIAVVAAASSPKIADAGEYIFRTVPEDRLLGGVLGKYAAKKYSKVAILSEQTDYGQDLKSVFIDTVHGEGREVFNEDFLSNTPDFRTLLLRLRARSPDAFFINAQAEQTFAIILRQLREIGWHPALLAAYWPSSPTLLEMAKSDLEGIEFVDTPDLSQILNTEGREALAAYRADGGQIRSVEAMWATSVEAYRAVDAALQSGKDPRQYLRSETFHGVFGEYRFNAKGEVEGMSPVMKKIVRGVAVPLEK